jgi:hypothetical protein
LAWHPSHGIYLTPPSFAQLMSAMRRAYVYGVIRYAMIAYQTYLSIWDAFGRHGASLTVRYHLIVWGTSLVTTVIIMAWPGPQQWGQSGMLLCCASFNNAVVHMVSIVEDHILHA